MATQILTLEETNVMPVTREKILREQAQDAYCRTLADQIGFKGSPFDVDHNGYIVRRSTFYGSLQKVVPKALRPRVLYLAHYPRLSGHPGAIRMYYTLTQQFYWPHMAHDVYTFVAHSSDHRRVVEAHEGDTCKGDDVNNADDRFLQQLGLPVWCTTTNGQVERLNHTLVSRLRHYTEEHQTGWDKLVQPLTYSYKHQVHRSTQATPFDLVLLRHPPGIVVQGDHTTSTAAGALTPAQVKRNTLVMLRRALKHAESRLTAAQKRYKADYDRRVTNVVSVSSGQYVYIDNPPSGRRPRPGDEADDEAIDSDINSKLLPKSVGPHKVLNASDPTVTVDQDGIPNTISIDRITVAPETVQHRMEAGTSAREPRALALRTRPSEDPTPIEVNDDRQRDDPDYNPLTGAEI
ncbi:unnamed protein product [Agarophyton chilense]